MKDKDINSLEHTSWRCQYHIVFAMIFFNHTSLCQFYQGRLLLHVTLPFEEKPKSNLPGENLKYYRQRKSLTTRQIAERIEVVPATILMYEQNKHPIPYDVTNSLASVLEVNAEVLYDDFCGLSCYSV